MDYFFEVEVLSIKPIMRADGSGYVQVEFGHLLPLPPEMADSTFIGAYFTISSPESHTEAITENKVILIFDRKEWEIVKKSYYVGAPFNFAFRKNGSIRLIKMKRRR